MKRNLIISTTIFFISLFCTFFIISSLNLKIESYNGALEAMIPGNIFKIFINNLGVCILMIVGSGIVTLPLLSIQGIQLGGLMGLWVSLGNSIFTYLILTIPHCIFEIPALLISSALGIKLFNILKNYYYKNEISSKNFILENKKSLLSIVILLVLAAVIECTLTVSLFNKII